MYFSTEKIMDFANRLSLYLATLTLTFYGYLGLFVRMIADDYCTAYRGRIYGVWNGVQIVYQTWASNYSNFVIKYSLAWMQPQFHPWVGIITLLLCLGAFYYLLHHLMKLIRFPVATIPAVLALTIIITFVFYRIMPAYQHAWWFSAVIPYTWSLALLVFLVGSLVHYTRHPYSLSRYWFMLTWVAVVVFILGGFVENIITTMIALSGMALLWGMYKPFARNREFMTIATVVLVVSIICIAIALLSPGAHERRAVVMALSDLPEQSLVSSLVPGLLFSLSYLFGEFFNITFGHTYVLPFFGYLACILFFVTISILEKYPDYQLPMPQSVTRAALLILGGGFITILANMWPLFYSTGAIPMRAVILPRLIQLVMVCGWIYLLIGTAQRDRWLLVLRRSYTWKYVLLACAILMIWTPATSTFKLLELLPDFQQYALGWDQRDLTLSILDQPVGTVYIDPFVVDIEDHLVLEKMIRESDPTDSFWVNACVASYYGFERVYIKEPGVP